MLRVVPVDEILHNGTALEQPDRASVGKGVRQGGNPAIGVYFQEPVLLLGILAEVDPGNLRRGRSGCPLATRVMRTFHKVQYLVLQPKLLEEDRHLDAVGSLGRVEVDIGFVSHLRRVP